MELTAITILLLLLFLPLLLLLYGNGLEDVETVFGCAKHHAGDLWVPVDLLDVFLPLVCESNVGVSLRVTPQKVANNVNFRLALTW